eukprot:Skav222408  [mRNA]  locus=scaffold4005:73454:73693:- [translate_table: standard]
MQLMCVLYNELITAKGFATTLHKKAARDVHIFCKPPAQLHDAAAHANWTFALKLPMCPTGNGMEVEVILGRVGGNVLKP